MLGFFSTITNYAAAQGGNARSSALANIQAKQNIAYRENPHSRQVLDFARPKNSSKVPLVMIVHGGSWEKGDKRSARNKVRYFIQNGYAIASTNYRLHPEVDPDEMASDIAAAFAWLHSQSDALNIDRTRMFIVGHSAGAHLVSLVGTNPDYLSVYGLSPEAISGIVALDTGLYDVAVQLNRVRKNTNYGRQLSDVFGSDPSFWDKVSPTHAARTGSTTLPKFLVVTSDGRADRDYQAKPFVAAINAAGGSAELIEAENRTHATLYQNFGTPNDPTTEAALLFMQDSANSSAQTSLSPPVQTQTTGNNPSDSENWEISFQAPQTDSKNRRLTGTEIMQIVTHENRLFAGNSYWNENREVRRGQVFRLDAANSRWELDLQMPAKYSRVAALAPVTFTTDWQGKSIGAKELLVAGATYDKGKNRPGVAGLFIRQPNGTWSQRDLGKTSHAFAYSQVRSFGFWQDRKTGVDRVFAGANPAPLGIYSGAYDASITGRVRWNEQAEFTPRGYQRIMGFAACGDHLYAATQRTVIRRNDGTRPSWETIIDLSKLRELQRYAKDLDPRWRREDDIRSFRCDPASKEPVLLFTGINQAWRFRPGVDRLPEVEQDLQALVKQSTGRSVHYIQAQDATTVVNTDGEVEEWVGTEFFYHPDYLKTRNDIPHWENGFGKDAWYFVRNIKNGRVSWDLRPLTVPNRDLDNTPLARVRDFEVSPFPNDQRVFAGGFAPWLVKVTNTAWIAVQAPGDL